MSDVKKIRPEDREKHTVDLPPAGDARRDELARRTDELHAAAEAQPVERERIDPTKFKVDREIAQRFNSLEISNADPAYAYCWVRFEKPGEQVRAKLAIRVRDVQTGNVVPTWEVVNGPMREAEELKAVDGTRRLGDVLLMRCRMERYEAIRAYEEQQARRQQDGIDSALRELGEKRGVRVNAVAGEHVSPSDLKREFAKQQGIHAFTQSLREGTVPGMEIRR